MPTPRLLSAGVTFAALVLAAPSLADAPPTTAARPAAVAQAEPAVATGDSLPAARRMSPAMLDVLAVLDSEREQIEALRVRLRQVRGHREALEIQRDIERVKLDTEAAILRIQAEAARRAGHAALAERLEIAARDLLAPPVATTTAVRPAPRAAGR